MRRFSALSAGVGLMLLAAGCGRSYEKRLEATLTQMKYQQKLDQYLSEPAGDPLKSLGIYLRTPKGMSMATQPGLAADPSQYELNATFLGEGGGGAAEKGGEAPAPVLRLHTLARVKRPKRAAKKGEPPPPEPAPRGKFIDDVRQLLAAELGNPEEALTKAAQDDTQKNNKFKRVLFGAGNGDTIKVYFFKEGESEVALIWAIPPSVDKSSANGVRYCLESLAVGPKAQRMFQGGSDEEDASSEGGAGGGGQVF